uniref:Uncharacterized protein n=1 Tax=Echeneis naucrates TaxID=173247 RepID=A0A665TZ53_ECHNA
MNFINDSIIAANVKVTYSSLEQYCDPILLDSVVAGFKRVTLSLSAGTVKNHQSSPAVTLNINNRMLSYMQILFINSYMQRSRRTQPDLVVCPAGLPHAQSLGVRELSLEAEQNPAVAEEQLEAVLPKSSQVLVEAGHSPCLD